MARSASFVEACCQLSHPSAITQNPPQSTDQAQHSDTTHRMSTNPWCCGHFAGDFAVKTLLCNRNGLKMRGKPKRRTFQTHFDPRGLTREQARPKFRVMNGLEYLEAFRKVSYLPSIITHCQYTHRYGSFHWE